MTDTPARLKAARGALSQAKAAAQLGIPLRTWENWERTITNPDGSVRTTQTTLITGKGQTYFVSRLLGESA